MKKEIFGLTVEEIAEATKPYGFETYRARQIADRLYRQGGVDFAEMTTMPKAKRQLLSGNFNILPVTEKMSLTSADGRTIKFLLEFADGLAVETVLMRQPYGNSVCVSTQVGCAMGCAFCASTLHGCVRNLSCGEILAQVMHINKKLYLEGTENKVDSIVIMGTGEPMANYENVLKFIRLCHEAYCLNMSYRRFTLSTCGIVPAVDRLSEEEIPITLSISLHAPDNETRSAIMPINKKYDINEIVAAGDRYAARTGRRVTYEYILIADSNDSPGHAQKLASLLAGRQANVNLIPINTPAESGFCRPSTQTIAGFVTILEKNGVGVTVRKEMGADIQAACGQLRYSSRNNPS